MPVDNWKDYAESQNVQAGICLCSFMSFNESIYGSKFEKAYNISGRIFLCRPIYSAKSYSEAKELLQIRLNRLKDFL